MPIDTSDTASAESGVLRDASRADSPNADLGGRRVCQKCGEKYYDLNKTPIVCPNPECGVAFDPSVLLKSRRVKLEVANKADAKPDDADTDTANADLDDYDSNADVADIPPVSKPSGDDGDD